MGQRKKKSLGKPLIPGSMWSGKMKEISLTRIVIWWVGRMEPLLILSRYGSLRRGKLQWELGIGEVKK